LPLRSGRYHFFRQILQTRVIEHRVREQSLEPGVRLLERPQALCVGHLDVAELRLTCEVVALDIPCSRQSSITTPPVSASFRRPMPTLLKCFHFILSAPSRAGF